MLLIGVPVMITLMRGCESWFRPVGVECDGYYDWDRRRPCPFGPGIVGFQRCTWGAWKECEAPEAGGGPGR